MDQNGHSKLEGDQFNHQLLALTACINESTLLDLAGRFSDTYRRLAKESTEHFLVTPITALPTGKEMGKFLVIDVGGTNLRVGFIELLGEVNHSQNDSKLPPAKIKRSYDKAWPIEEHLKMDKAEDLFLWIGDCIAEVIADALADVPVSESIESQFGEELLLGITFSFPMSQTSLSEATLLKLGKGFAINSDLDLKKMILAGYARHVVEPTKTNGDSEHAESTPSTKKRRLSRMPRIRIAAITNDTVATFASLAYTVKAAPNSRVSMGLIVGTGTNATVPMKVDYLHESKIKELANPEGVENVVINTEWTIRGTDQPLTELGIKTKWDLQLDRESDSPGFQPFEYMTAGRYLGEIVRLVLVDLVSSESGEEVLPPSLKLRNALPTRYLSEVVARTDDESLGVKLENQFPSPLSGAFWTSSRVRLIQLVAHAVQQRSSALIAAATIGLLACVGDILIERLGKADVKENGTSLKSCEFEELVVAYTGGTIAQYPKWRETCQKWIDVLVKKGSHDNMSKRVVLKEALDGGVIGAGVLAGMVDDIA